MVVNRFDVDTGVTARRRCLTQLKDAEPPNTDTLTLGDRALQFLATSYPRSVVLHVGEEHGKGLGIVITFVVTALHSSRAIRRLDLRGIFSLGVHESLVPKLLG